MPPRQGVTQVFTALAMSGSAPIATAAIMAVPAAPASSRVLSRTGTPRPLASRVFSAFDRAAPPATRISEGAPPIAE